MSEQTRRKTAPLAWLRPEIDRSIFEARHSLGAALLDRNEQATLLLDGCARVRQVRGALDVLEFEGAARFCRVLEEAFDTFLAEHAKLDRRNAAVVDRSLFALSQFVADLAQGEADMPLKLFPVYKELSALCGRTYCAEAELFYPDITAAAVRATRPSRMHPSTLAAHLFACCTLFRRGLVSWLKPRTRLEGVGMMRSALDGLQRAAGACKVHPALWWTAAGLVDTLTHAEDGITLSAVKITLTRLERAMTALSSGSEIDSDALMREILYPIAVAQPVTGRVREIKTLYRLDSHIPEFCVSGTLEHDTPALAPVLDVMRRKLERIEQGWIRCARGTPGSLSVLRAEIDALASSARDLGHYRLSRLLDVVLMIVAKLPEAAAIENENLTLEMAAAFLFMEGMLDHFTDPPPDIDQQVAVVAGILSDAMKPIQPTSAMSGLPRNDITQRRQVDVVRSRVLQEIQKNLLRVEEIVEQAARDPAASTGLSAVAPPLAQAAGALSMLGLNRAHGVLTACAQLLRACATNGSSTKLYTLQWAADGLSCLGFYLDVMQRGGKPADELLTAFVRRMANQSELPAGSTGWIPAGTGSIEEDTPPEAATFAPSMGSEILLPENAPMPLSTATHSTHTTGEEPDPALMPVFLDEARVLLGRLYNDLVAWRSAPHDVRAARASARTLHTLKGSARLVGALRLADLTHSLESHVEAALKASEHEGEPFEFAPLQSMLATITEQFDLLAALNNPHRALVENGPAIARPAPQRDLFAAPSTVRVSVAVLNGLVNQAGELSEVRARIEDELGTMRRSLHELSQSASRHEAQLRRMAYASQPTARADAADSPAPRDAPERQERTCLHELRLTMAESLQEIQTLQQSLVVHCAAIETALALHGRPDRNLRHTLLEFRSLPFGSMAERLHRTVRHTAAHLGRKAELQIEGETVAVDRNVLQRLVAPLEHMLRNALAHGIEPASARIAAGKPPVGTVRLVMEQSDDENVLTLSDDGAGLDIDQIRAQAVHLGLVAAGDCVSERLLNRLIFAPGLSTAARVTAASGRGVGLDVVRAEVRALGGSIEVNSERAAGTSFRIRFPASLSYTQALLVRSEGRVYAIPATLVERVCELPADALHTARGDGRLTWKGHVYRFADLSRLLGNTSPPPAPSRANSVLLLHGESERTALHVEQMVRKQAIERKNIGPQLARVRGIAGATIIGNGEVVLILDPDELVLYGAHRGAHAAAAPPPSPDAL